MVLAHIGGVPVEELLPAAAAGASVVLGRLLVAVRRVRLSRRGRPSGT